MEGALRMGCSIRSGRAVVWGAIALVTIAGCQSQSAQDSLAPASPGQQPPASNSPLSVPPPPPPGAYLGKISPAVSSQLQGLPLLAPAYIPAGFTLAEHGTTPSKGYYLIYRSPDQCFAIEHTGPKQPPENLPADITLLSVESFDSPIFGPNRRLYHSKAEPAPTKLISQWLTSSQGAYRLVGADTVQTYPDQSPCQNVPLTEAINIIVSMTDLTVGPTDSVGD
ncbi:MAG: hypothetical protein WBB01_16045 [Phormidesmis sp.]